jgi:hypothetical protein
MCFDFRQGKQIPFFTKMPKPPLQPTQPLIQYVPGPLPSHLKKSGHEADNHLYVVPKLRITGASSPLHQVHRDNLTLIVIIRDCIA